MRPLTFNCFHSFDAKFTYPTLMLFYFSSSVLPLKGNCPVSMKNSMMPRDHTSHFFPYLLFFSLCTSGAMY